MTKFHNDSVKIVDLIKKHIFELLQFLSTKALKNSWSLRKINFCLSYLKFGFVIFTFGHGIISSAASITFELFGNCKKTLQTYLWKFHWKWNVFLLLFLYWRCKGVEQYSWKITALTWILSKHSWKSSSRFHIDSTYMH